MSEFIEQLDSNEDKEKQKLKRFISEIRTIEQQKFPFDNTNINYEEYLLTASENAINRRYNTMVLERLREITGRQPEIEMEEFVKMDLNREQRGVLINLIEMKKWEDVNLQDYPQWTGYGDEYGNTRTLRGINGLSDTLYASKTLNRRLLKPPSREELLEYFFDENHQYHFVIRSQNVRKSISIQYNVTCNMIGTKFSCNCPDMIKTELGYQVFEKTNNRIRLWDRTNKEFFYVYPIRSIMPCKHIRMCYAYLKLQELNNEITMEQIREKEKEKKKIRVGLERRAELLFNEVFQSYCYSDGKIKSLYDKSEKSQVKRLSKMFHQKEYYQVIYFNLNNKLISMTQLYQGEKIQKNSIKDYTHLFAREGFKKQDFFRTLNVHYGWTEFERGLYIAKNLAIYFKPVVTNQKEISLFKESRESKRKDIVYYVPNIEAPDIEFQLNKKKRKKSSKKFTTLYQKVKYSSRKISCSCFTFQKGHLRYCEHIIALYQHLINREENKRMTRWVQLSHFLPTKVLFQEFIMENSLAKIYGTFILPKLEQQLDLEYLRSIKNNESLIYLKTGFQRYYYSYRIKINYQNVGKQLTLANIENKKKRKKEWGQKNEEKEYFNKKKQKQIMY